LVTLFSASSYGMTISSTFDTDAEGWTGSGASVVYESTGGNPDGFIKVGDTGNVAPLNSGILAPGAFLGDLSAFIGGTLSVDFRSISGSNANTVDAFGTVWIQGGGSDVFFDLTTNSPGAWATYSVPLTAAAWGVSELLWASIMGNVTTLGISTDAFDGADVVGVDNVTISQTPLPAAIWLFLSALGVLGLYGRRRRTAG
jgi:hypothetical protein